MHQCNSQRMSIVFMDNLLLLLRICESSLGTGLLIVLFVNAAFLHHLDETLHPKIVQAMPPVSKA